MYNRIFLGGDFEFESQMRLWKVETIEDYDRFPYEKATLRRLSPSELYKRIIERQNKARYEEWKAVLYSYLNDHQRYNTMR